MITDRDLLWSPLICLYLNWSPILHVHADDLDALQVAIAVADEALGHHLVLTGVLAKLVSRLSMTVVHPNERGNNEISFASKGEMRVRAYTRARLKQPQTSKKVLQNFLCPSILPEHARPLGPGVVGRTFDRGFVEQLQVNDVCGTMSDAGSNAVCASVTSTDHHDVLASSADVVSINKVGV